MMAASGYCQNHRDLRTNSQPEYSSQCNYDRLRVAKVGAWNGSDPM